MTASQRSGTGPRTFVVIGGLARSGTQLTRRVLGSHSAIAVINKELKVREVVEGRTDVSASSPACPSTTGASSGTSCSAHPSVSCTASC